MGNRGRRVSTEDRQYCVELVLEGQGMGVRKRLVCTEVLGISVRTLERWEGNTEDRRKGPLRSPSNALRPEERTQILKVLTSPEFVDLPPAQIIPKLADQNIYLASESTCYRLLRQEKLLTHRSKSKPKQRKKPLELEAKRPNQIWSWDITFLKSPIRGQYYFLYLFMDIFSRKIVYSEVKTVQSDELSSLMITKACKEYGIHSEELTLHSDNGGPMKGATMLATLQALGVASSFSRPRVSDDNPYSEALFKTLKYNDLFPNSAFSCLQDAIDWTNNFKNWYNNEHLHSAIQWVTPASRHDNKDFEILGNRTKVYLEAREKNPNRWSKNIRNWSRVEEVRLNPGKSKIQRKVS
jgi:putative transposase